MRRLVDVNLEFKSIVWTHPFLIGGSWVKNLLKNYEIFMNTVRSDEIIYPCFNKIEQQKEEKLFILVCSN